jgi:hypothetical protein
LFISIVLRVAVLAGHPEALEGLRQMVLGKKCFSSRLGVFALAVVLALWRKNF